jgi:hypothetical protein
VLQHLADGLGNRGDRGQPQHYVAGHQELHVPGLPETKAPTIAHISSRLRFGKGLSSRSNSSRWSKLYSKTSVVTAACVVKFCCIPPCHSEAEIRQLNASGLELMLPRMVSDYRLVPVLVRRKAEAITRTPAAWAQRNCKTKGGSCMRQLFVVLSCDEGQDLAEYAVMVAVILLVVGILGLIASQVVSAIG